MWYKVKWTGYDETTQELKENLKNAEKKIKKYYKKAGQAIKRIRNQREVYQLKATDEL